MIPVDLVPSTMQSHGSHRTIHPLPVGCRRTFLLWIAIVVLLPPIHGCSRSPSINKEVAREAAGLIEVEVSPPFRFHFDRMQKGVLQHLDRDYTYDFVPTELEGGILFQGIHRPPAGTVITLKLLAPATLYFFFHEKVHGGYDRIFAELESWQACDDFPKYDIHNGDHGLKMNMYRMEAMPGLYRIPPTTSDRACFNFVVQPTAGE